MALKSTIYKAALQIADIDRGLYTDHALTLARHPSETEERLMVRLLAYALHLPADEQRGRLEMARGLSDTDEPDLWQRDLSGVLVHWIEVGQPDERRLLKAAGRAERVTVIAYGATVASWWAPLRSRLARASNVEIWQLPNDQSRALAALAQRSMQLQVNVHDALVWVGDGARVVELTLQRLTATP